MRKWFGSVILTTIVAVMCAIGIIACGKIDSNANNSFAGIENKVGINTSTDIDSEAVTDDGVASVTADGVTTNYSTIEEAWAAALSKSSATIKLLDNVTAANTFVISAQDKSITLDLNGYTFNLNGDEENSVYRNISVVKGATFTLTDTGVGGNGVLTGGYSSNGGAVNVAGTFKFDGGTISGNTSGGSGGAVYVDSNASFIMTGGTISDNTSKITTTYYGGGAVFGGYSIEITGGKIINNTAYGRGGGICLWQHTSLSIQNCEISGNTAKSGGGIFDDPGVIRNSKITISDSTITNNTADEYAGMYYSVGMSVSGKTVISGNKTTDGKDSNLTFYGNSLTISGALTDGASIGVTSLSTSLTAFTSGYSAYNSALPSTYFTSDDESYIIVSSYHTTAKTIEAALGTQSDLSVRVEYVDGDTPMTYEFESINQAMGFASNKTATVTLLADVKATAYMQLASSDKGNVTLNLNGKVLDLNGYYISDGASLTITDSASDSSTRDITVGDKTYAISGGVITGGKYSNGGAINVGGSASLVLNGGALLGNTATSAGGAVYVSSSGGTFTMTGGALLGNTATATGGAVYMYAGTFTMTGGEISGNTAGGTYGGGVYSTTNGNIYINNSVTIYGNTLTSGAANNLNLVSGKYINIQGDISGSKIGVTIENGAAGIFTNGYATYNSVHPSEYFSADTAGFCVGYSYASSKFEAAIGAAEEPVARVAYDDNEYDFATINYAFAYAVGKTAKITLLADAANTENLVSITSGDITYDLNGKTHNLNGKSYILVDGKSAVLTIIDSSENADGKITGGSNGNGGALFVSNGTVNFRSGTISGNQAVGGGATSMGGGGGIIVNPDGILNMYGGVITDNQATVSGDGRGGGGVFVNGGTFNMYGGEIYGNTAKGNGGGVHVYANTGVFVMYGGTITDNNGTNGGGVYVYNTTSTFTMLGGEISGNQATGATGKGGGVFMYGSNGVFNVGGEAVIKNNTLADGETIGNVNIAANKKINVTEALVSGASIGVTMAAGTGTFTTGYNTANGTAEPGEYFVSDTESYFVALDDSGEVELTLGVASVTTADGNVTYYTNIGSAFSAAISAGRTEQTRATVTLLANITANAKTSLEGGYLKLDLNGFTYSSTNLSTYVIQTSSNIIITDESSAKTGTLSGGSCVVFVTGGVCTIEGGTFTGSNIGIQANDGTTNINGGKITGITGNGINVAVGVCNISGGEICDNKQAIARGANARGYYTFSGNPIIKDNETNVPFAMAIVAPLTDGAEIHIGVTGVITSGYKDNNGSTDPNTYFKTDIDDKLVYLNADGEVVVGDGVASVTTADGTVTKYATISAAVTYINANAGTTAATGMTLTLLTNIDTSSTVAFSSSSSVRYITLDLNGYVLRRTGTGRVVSTSKINLTVTDSNPDNVNNLGDGNGTFTYNDVAYKGGVITGGNLTTSQTTSTTGSGAGILINSTSVLTLKGGSIVGNSAVDFGGGIYIANLTAGSKIAGGVIADNTAKTGGGIYSSYNLTMSAGKIINNTSSGSGSAIYLPKLNVLTISGGEISGNNSTSSTGYAIDTEGQGNSNTVIKLSGNPVIKDNTINGKTPANLYLNKLAETSNTPSFITVGKLTDGADIHFTSYVYNNKGSSYAVFTIGYNANNPGVSPARYFTYDNASKCIYLSGGEEAAIGDPVAQVTVAGGEPILFGSIAEAFSEANSQVTTSSGVATVKLLANVKAASTLTVNSGSYIELDLDGKTLTYSGSDNVITVNGSLKITGAGGVISGGKTGGIVVNSGGVFVMSVGTISGNVGGGVIVNSGTFTMTGGEISGNTATNYGGGVSVYGDNAVFNVGGDAVIKNNTLAAGSTINNVYLAADKKINVTETLLSGASIGVTMATDTGVITTGYKTAHGNADPSDYFVSDGNGYLVTLDNSGEVRISASVVSVTFDGVTENYLDIEEAFEYANTIEGSSEDKLISVKILDNATVSASLKVKSGHYIELDLNGYVLSGNKTSSVITIEANGYLALMDSRSTVANTVAVSSGQAEDGKVTVQGGVITGGCDTNTIKGGANGGGGGGIRSSGEFVMKGGNIIGNSAYLTGGGVYVISGSFEMFGGNISYNMGGIGGNAGGGGVGIYGGSFTLHGGSITHNGIDSVSSGGGVSVAAGCTFTMEGGTISDNSSPVDGGGVSVAGTFTMIGGEISGNTASRGGGVYVSGTINIGGSAVIENNTKSDKTTKSNVYLQTGKTINVTAVLSDAHIGVTLFEGMGVITNGYKAANGSDDPSEYFFADLGSPYIIDLSNGEARITQVIKITFYDHDGTLIEEITAGAGDIITPPEDPVRESSVDKVYTFEGWFNAQETGSKINFGSAITADVTAYAHYSESARLYKVTVSVDTTDDKYGSVDNEGNEYEFAYGAKFIVNGSDLTVEASNNSIKFGATAYSGFVFDCFKLKNSDGELIDLPSTLTGDTDIVAVFIASYDKLDSLEVLGAVGTPTAGDTSVVFNVKLTYKDVASGEVKSTVEKEITVDLEGYLRGGNNSVTVSYSDTDDTGHTTTLEAEVTVNAAAKKVNVSWYYNGVQKTSAERDYTGSSDLTKLEAEYTALDGTIVKINAANAAMQYTKDGAATDTPKNAGVYKFGLKNDPDYEFIGNEFTFTINKAQINLADENTYKWTLDGYGSDLRSGKVYIYTVSGVKEYYATPQSGKGDAQIIDVTRSYARYRGTELTIVLNNGVIADLPNDGGKRSSIEYSNNTYKDVGSYSATAALRLSDTENYIYVSNGLDSTRLMSIEIGDNGTTAVIKKSWYILKIDNGLKSQADGTYGNEYIINGWTFGDDVTVYAPRLEHGDEGDRGEQVTFGENDNRVMFELMYLTSETESVKIGNTFNRCQFDQYINKTMPAGRYMLKVTVVDITVSADHVHWWESADSSTEDGGTFFAGFTREFNFTVGQARINVTDEIKENYNYTYDGELHLYGDDKIFAMLIYEKSAREGVWGTDACDSYYGFTVQFNLKRWNNDEYIAIDDLKAIPSDNNKPVAADTYTVYYRIVAPNYGTYGGDGDKKFTVVIGKKTYTEEELSGDIEFTLNGETNGALKTSDGASVDYDKDGYSIGVKQDTVKEGVHVSFGQTLFTDANTYTVAVTFTFDGNYAGAVDGTTLKLVINKINYDTSDWVLVDVATGKKLGAGDNGELFTYDGNTHTFRVDGVDDGVTVTINGNGVSAAGDHTVTASFAGDANHNSLDGFTLSSSFNIKKAQVTTEGVVFKAPDPITYDGKEHAVKASNLPDGVVADYTYSGNMTDADEYTITLTLTADGNHEFADGAQTVFVINVNIDPAEYDTSNLVFGDVGGNVTVVYDGNEHSITFDGLPEHISVEYDGNGKTEIGKYTVTATLTSNKNYVIVGDTEFKATLYILATDLVVYADVDGETVWVSAHNDKGFTYGTELVIEQLKDYASDLIDGDIGAAFDIKLVDADGNSVQPNGTITVRLLIPEELRNLDGEKLVLIHMHDGSASKISFTADGNYAVFTTDSLSEFVFAVETVEDPEIPDEPDTPVIPGDDDTKDPGNDGTPTTDKDGEKSFMARYWWLWLLILLLIILIIILIIIFRRKKDDEDETAAAVVAPEPNVALAPEASEKTEEATEEQAVEPEQELEVVPEQEQAPSDEQALESEADLSASVAEKAEAEEAARKQAEEEAKKKERAAKAKATREANAAKRKAEQEAAEAALAAALAIAEEDAKRIAEEEAKKRAEDEAKKKERAAKAKATREANAAKRKAEQEAAAAAAALAAEEDAKRIAEEEAKKQAEEEAKKKERAAKAKAAREARAAAKAAERERIAAEEAQRLLADEQAAALIEESEEKSDRTRQSIVNIDMLSKYFNDGETVTLNELKKRVPKFDRRATYLKVLARGTLDKKLTVIADHFSLDAVKMIVLTGGNAIKKGKKQ